MALVSLSFCRDFHNTRIDPGTVYEGGQLIDGTDQTTLSDYMNQPQLLPPIIWRSSISGAGSIHRARCRQHFVSIDVNPLQMSFSRPRKSFSAVQNAPVVKTHDIAGPQAKS
jgi:hypothetical protein